MNKIFYSFFALFAGFIIYSCSDNSINQNNDILIYEEAGLVDSVIVTGCYAYTRRHFLNDTFYSSNYSKLKIEFECLTSSDFASVSVLSHNNYSANNVLYEKFNQNVNSNHSFEIAALNDTTWFELRLYLNPQICGQNEYKFIRARDLRIFGVK